MRFTASLFAILAATSALASAVSPATEGDSNVLISRAGEWGKCNGTSCKVNGKNYACNKGKCTAQSGGGDGKACNKLGGSICCPGGRMKGKTCP
ncbi:hypothetical protein BFJ70_g15809 [Fusarium oxysporum]|uniref:Bubble protein n=1 Tax=Fusarium oxysporum f. sp. melonis 26406 TaxID=1089452 RepID=W9YWC4_FUSOX|nr:hypothetical protein FOMG_19746 [Fusarium oxysporum f. sp. melonis 26406]RKL13855.1 hypothetical protein BFJ70_g15809 [Fusarium oxysporum]